MPLSEERGAPLPPAHPVAPTGLGCAFAAFLHLDVATEGAGSNGPAAYPEAAKEGGTSGV
jgi:hypothetical protein